MSSGGAGSLVNGTGDRPGSGRRHARGLRRLGSETRRKHRAQVLARLRWRWCGAGERKQLDEFLLDRALEHDAPGVLLQLAVDWLRGERIVPPMVEALTRRIAAARDAACAETYHRLGPLLDGHRPLRVTA